MYFYLKELSEPDIRNHEELMLSECKKVYDRYKEAFAEYQCTMMFKLSWPCWAPWLPWPKNNTIYTRRPPLKRGYCCELGFWVQKNEKKVWVETGDEYGNECLENGFAITWNDGLFHNKFVLNADTDILEEEIEYYLELLKTCPLVEDSGDGR